MTILPREPVAPAESWQLGKLRLENHRLTGQIGTLQIGKNASQYYRNQQMDVSSVAGFNLSTQECSYREDILLRDLGNAQPQAAERDDGGVDV